VPWRSSETIKKSSAGALNVTTAFKISSVHLFNVVGFSFFFFDDAEMKGCFVYIPMMKKDPLGSCFGQILHILGLPTKDNSPAVRRGEKIEILNIYTA
jgi:hypothetical protein